MHPRSQSRPSLATRMLRILTVLAVTIAAVAMPIPASAAPAPIVIDDFGGTRISDPVTTAPSNGTSTPPTWSGGDDGTMTYTLFGNGNTATSVSTTWSFAATDLTSAGNNTQFMVGLNSVTRGPNGASQDAVYTQVALTDADGHSGQYNTGFQNVGEFDLVLNFECVNGAAVCFSGDVDFTRITGVTLSFFYPMSHEDPAKSTVVVVDELRTTPTGGAQPAAPSAGIELATPTSAGVLWYQHIREITYDVAFTSGGQPADITTVDQTQFVAATSGTLSATVTDVEPTLSNAFRVTVLVTSGTGTLQLVAGEGAVTDTWDQRSTEVTGSPVTVQPGVAPTSSSSQSFAVVAGQQLSVNVVALGTPTPQFSSTISLPGITVAADGRITGVLTTVGTQILVVQATNPLGSATIPVSITVEDIRFISADSATFDTVSGGTHTVSWIAPAGTTIEYGALPEGLTATQSGSSLTIEGSPTRAASGVTFVPLTLTSPSGAQVTQNLAVTVIAAPQFVVGSRILTATIGVPFSTTFVTDGQEWPTITGLSPVLDLPDGLQFYDNRDGTAMISGTPTGPAGSSQVGVTATNGPWFTTEYYTIWVQAEPSIEPIEPQRVETGTIATVPITVAGDPAPTITTSTLPDWITLTGNSVEGWSLVAAPTAAGLDEAVTLTARNGAGTASTVVEFSTFELPGISGPGELALVRGEVVPSDASYTLTGIPAPQLSVTGLPDGVTFVRDGGTLTFTGTPEGAAGTYPVTIEVTSPDGSDTLEVTISITEAPELTAIPDVSAPLGTPVSQTVTATGSPTPALSAAGVPDGVAFVDNHDGTGTFSGTPDAAGSWSITVTAENTAGSASEIWMLESTLVPTITSASSVAFETGIADEFTVTTEAFPTAALSAAALPDGLVFTDNGDGTATIGGTPSRTGREMVTIVADNGTASATQDLVVTVYSEPTFQAAASASFRVGEAGRFSVSATGFPVPALSVSGTLPNGLSFVDNGDGTAVLAGTPTAAGTFAVTLGATIRPADADATALQTFALVSGDVTASQALTIVVQTATVGPEEPGTDPEEPGTEPEEPGTEPEEPGTEPEEPGTEPEEPGTEPEEPGTEPEEPGTEPEEPGEPGTEPEEPGTEPEEPGTEPEEPGTPGGVDPTPGSEGGADPSDPAPSGSSDEALATTGAEASWWLLGIGFLMTLAGVLLRRRVRSQP